MEGDEKVRIVPMGVSEMSPEERPREKAERLGIKSLNDAELMAILFRTGSQGHDVMALSREILNDYGGHLSQVARMSIDQMCQRYKGLGRAKATTLLAALEVGARAAVDAETQLNNKITSSRDAYLRMKARFSNLPHEEFRVLMLNNGLMPIKEVLVAKGGTVATYVDVKIVLKEAIGCLAQAMILFHNHPSGMLRPSTQDDSLTKKIVDSARILDIRVNDHIIVSDAGYYSYHDEGKL